MFQTEFLPILLFAVGTSSAIAVASFLTARKRSETDDSLPDLAENSHENEVYTLRGGHLVEASFVARRRLDRIGLAPDDISKLRHRLSQRFENATDLLLGAKDQGDLRSPSRDGNLQAVREVAGNEVRLEVMSRHSAEPGRRDLHCLDAEGEELRMLRANTEVAPFLLWRQNKDGDVIWANKSYLAAATELFGLQRASMWPIPSLFRSTAVLKSGARDHVVRIQSVANVSDHKDWFDCHITEVDGDALCTAFPADEAVRSEARRQEFTQTLTKTFSDLSIGLAIFDRSRRLALFNPAVCDLTSLPVDFLTSRPSLVGFLDQLREKRVMPEPRDYRAWRNSIADLETA
ncbi:MAG: hypothetical protein HKN98_02155, partial [Silicimonas sp.]|nr:hypothetical protein [Silicimonas sp.]